MPDMITRIAAAETLIGGKWKMTILAALIQAQGDSPASSAELSTALRFNELKRLIPALTQRMLSIQLKALEADGLIERKVFAVVPPKVEYRLSEQALSLTPVLKALSQWSANA